MNSEISIKELLDGVEVEWTTLADDNFIEIANKGRKPVKASLQISGNIPYYGANNIQDFVDGYTHNGNFVLIAEDVHQVLKVILFNMQMENFGLIIIFMLYVGNLV